MEFINCELSINHFQERSKIINYKTGKFKAKEDNNMLLPSLNIVILAINY